MAHDWLLFETLGPQPVVVAQGRALRKFVAIESFLRRNPHRDEIVAAVQTAMAAEAGGRTREIAQGPRVIRTRPVVMSDGRVHGVQVWAGSVSAICAQPPTIGAICWNLTTGEASDTPQALLNSGMNPDSDLTGRRTFADDLVNSELHADEAAALALAINARPGQTFCSTWDGKAHNGDPIRVSFCARTALEQRTGKDTRHLVARAMNWSVPLESPRPSGADLAQQILRGTSKEGIYRAIVDLNQWRLLKWIDLPCPHFDWRGEEVDRPLVHPEDHHHFQAMTEEFERGSTEAILRLRSGSGWTPMSVSIFRIELDKDVYAALFSIRLPTPAELLELRSTRSLHSGH